MSDANDTEIYAALVKDDDSRKIIELCRSSKTTEELKRSLFNYKHGKYPATYKYISDVETLLGQRLAVLEQLKAIKYQNGKWESTAASLSVLSKYFGI